MEYLWSMIIMMKSNNILMDTIFLHLKQLGGFFNSICMVSGKCIELFTISFEMKLHIGHEPNVVRLPIHLSHEQQIVFNPSTNAQHILESYQNTDTALMAFFKINQLLGPTHDLAWTLTYQEFPNHFIIKSDETNPQSKVWSCHQHISFAIGWMIYVGPTAGERFYLQTLPMVIRGPKSFNDLKTVNSESCETFHEACINLGLLDDDGKWEICLQDAANIKTGPQLCHLFTTLLLFCTPTHPNVLWQHFHNKIYDYLQHRLSDLGQIIIRQEDIQLRLTSDKQSPSRFRTCSIRFSINATISS